MGCTDRLFLLGCLWLSLVVSGCLWLSLVTDNLRAGVVMMLFLVWVIILSIVQDYVWLLLNPPLPEVTSASDSTEQSADGDAGQEDNSKDDVEDANEKSNDTGKPVETEVVADESGDDI